MTSLFQARRRTEEFAAAVDDRGAGRHAGGEEITELLEVVESLREQPLVEPRAEFAADLRLRLMVEAQTTLSPQTAGLRLPTRERGRRERRLVAAASAFVLVGGTTTMAAAAQSALPGEALYPVKRGIERVEAGLNTSTAGKGHDVLDQARDRLGEVERLIASDSDRARSQVPETITAFSATAAEGSALMFEAFGDSYDRALVVEVRTFTRDGVATIEELASSTPSEARDELAAAAVLLTEIDREAADLCDTCAPGLPALEVPGILLTRAEVDRALQLAAARVLENDHPVEVSEELLALTRQAAEQVPPPTDAPAGASGSDPDVQAPEAPANPLPAPTLEPDEWPSLLPGLEGTTTDQGTSDPTEKVREDLEETLDGVTTLLPGTDGLLD